MRKAIVATVFMISGFATVAFGHEFHRDQFVMSPSYGRLQIKELYADGGAAVVKGDRKGVLMPESLRLCIPLSGPNAPNPDAMYPNDY